MGNIILFESKKVRRVWNEKDQKWYFSIQDVIEILTGSADIKQYVKKLKSRDPELKVNWGTICTPVEMPAADGKMRKVQASDTEGLLRIIQSIPSSKAEPFKRWLAKVGYERLEEIANPELAAKRMREIYKLKGYSDEWIEKRMRGIAVRDELTGEWKKRGVKEQKEYSILTAEISKATFGMTPSEYKNFKALDKPTDNLRDHMTDLELIFTMLGEASTTEIARKKDAQGFPENKKAAHEGGTIAGNARSALEKKSGKRVSVKENYKELPEIKRKSIRHKENE
ncbi:MAG: Bro-N domain-containing protein [Proteobacteria bacterium]|nr:Bro-N domain-containing protein [Pseudomonadota bacterium]MBU1713557.1 Bro-N domain-containing protein [Pseudomonadota bacterium]